MKLDLRIMKLEASRRSAAAEHDFSVLNDDELRVIAALPVSPEDRVDLGDMSSSDLDQLEAIMAKLEATTAGTASLG